MLRPLIIRTYPVVPLLAPSQTQEMSRADTYPILLSNS